MFDVMATSRTFGSRQLMQDVVFAWTVLLNMHMSTSTTVIGTIVAAMTALGSCNMRCSECLARMVALVKGWSATAFFGRLLCCL